SIGDDSFDETVAAGPVVGRRGAVGVGPVVGRPPMIDGGTYGAAFGSGGSDAPGGLPSRTVSVLDSAAAGGGESRTVSVPDSSPAAGGGESRTVSVPFKYTPGSSVVRSCTGSTARPGSIVVRSSRGITADAGINAEFDNSIVDDSPDDPARGTSDG